MGLDITAYRKLTKLDVVFNEDGEAIDPATRDTIDNYLRVYENPDFPGRAEGLEHRAAYSYKDAEHVFSRSYGGYGGWRETLAKLAGYPATPIERFGVTDMLHAGACWNGATGPFSELINFADNEGTIGPVVCTKLLRDFIEFDDRAKASGALGFYSGYCDIRRGLEMAADGGALDFH